ncbi:hypothetical protein [Streptomyces bluensis]|uniref:hypothetical protein n=1 Tax=Streptomyces bluensis TaxID=33897 RepID=UPI00167A13A2|nr:hypothetical protein [Streptomyces bluensis]GGZ77535.1 hypothetical protein GCM10010344_50760 [Streptomyces bluensis]
MSNQPYGAPYEGYDPYQQQPGQQGQAGQQQPGYQPQPGYQQPDWQGHDETQAAHAQQYTQQWEGQTWETQVHMPTAQADVTETAYMSPGHQQYSPQQPSPASYAPQQPSASSPPSSYAAQQPPSPDGTAAPAPAQPSSAPEEPGYGPPTLTGNARVTDAQRARAEGRSPIIEPGAQPALITAVLGALLAGAAVVGQYALVVPLVILQAVTAAGWFRLNGMWPARQGIALAFAGAVTADVVLLAAGRENAPAAILGTLGVWVLLALVLQLRSHADPDERMYGLMATVASAALSIIAAGHLAAAPDAVSVGAGAVAVAIVVRALPLPTVVSVTAALLAGAGAGLVLGGMTGVGTPGAYLGLGAAVCALIGHRVAGYDYPSRFVHMTAGVALPLAAAAPAVYLLGRALG